MRLEVRTKFVLLAATLWCLTSIAAAQATENVLYSFGDYSTDGTYPVGGLVFDSAGNIYGVTGQGGAYCQNIGGCGTVYELKPNIGGGWTETTLYSFCSGGGICADGSGPIGGLIMDPEGNLYGTTTFGGDAGVGTVFRLSPPKIEGGTWIHTVLWSFAYEADNGIEPAYGSLAMDSAGNIYGTTSGRNAPYNLGVVFELSPIGNGDYTFAIIHSFSGPDGSYPQYGVSIDSAGNLYGTTKNGGRGKSICSVGCGLVYELSPVNGTWQETVLYEFDGVTGAYPVSPISFDALGNLYGTFEVGGGGNCFFGTCGGVFKLVPEGGHIGKKYAFYFNAGPTGGSPQNGVLATANSVVYGSVGLFGEGNVYMLRGGKETILYNFCSLPNCSDGSGPAFGTVVSHQGLLYGITSFGGQRGFGVVYSISQQN